MIDQLTVLSFASRFGDSRSELQDAMISAGHDEAEVYDAVALYAQTYEDSEGESLWPDAKRDQERRDADLEDRAARLIDAEAA